MSRFDEQPDADMWRWCVRRMVFPRRVQSVTTALPDYWAVHVGARVFQGDHLGEVMFEAMAVYP